MFFLNCVFLRKAAFVCSLVFAFLSLQSCTEEDEKKANDPDLECGEVTDYKSLDTYKNFFWHLDATNGIDYFSSADKADGSGVRVALVTDGLDTRHCQLKTQYDAQNSYNYYNGSTDPRLSDDFIARGTAMGGLIAASDSEGARGIAPKSLLVIFNLLNSLNDDNIADAAYRLAGGSKNFFISANSWLSEPSDKSFIQPSEKWFINMRRGIELELGITGSGISYVWAAGVNQNRDSNMNGYANYIGSMAVCATNAVSDRANFSPTGSNLFICAPSFDNAIITTDVLGEKGYNGDKTTEDFTDRFGDKKNQADVPTAIVAGGLAFLQSYGLKINKTLSWVEWRMLLAASARQNQPQDVSWVETRSMFGSWNAGKKYKHSEIFGFGILSIKNAIQQLDLWQSPLNQDTLEFSSSNNASSVMARAMSESGEELAYHESTITLDGFDLTFIYGVEVEIIANMSNFSVTLVSPTGIESHLIPDAMREGVVFDTGNPIRLTSVRDMGYTSGEYGGKWSLRVAGRLADTAPDDFKEWKLKVYGSKI